MGLFDSSGLDVRNADAGSGRQRSRNADAPPTIAPASSCWQCEWYPEGLLAVRLDQDLYAVPENESNQAVCWRPGGERGGLVIWGVVRRAWLAQSSRGVEHPWKRREDTRWTQS
jgi:hypothetical protein